MKTLRHLTVIEKSSCECLIDKCIHLIVECNYGFLYMTRNTVRTNIVIVTISTKKRRRRKLAVPLRTTQGDQSVRVREHARANDVRLAI